MKRTWIVLFLLLTLVLLTGASVAAQSTASLTANAPDLTSAAAGLPRWLGYRVDRPTIGAGDTRGTYPSVVVAKGTTYVSYYDATNKDLRLAHYVGSSGDCGPSSSWKCEVIDSGGDVGKYSSLAVDTHSSNLHLGIAYYDATHYSLKYASYSCFGGICGANVYTIMSPGVPALIGQYASLKFDSSGGAYVAYQVYSTNSYVGYAHTVSSGGNCGPSNGWRCDLIAAGGSGNGRYTSLALSTYGDPRIAYYDADNGDLRIALYLGTGTGTCYNADWWCGRVDLTGDMGRFASLHVDQANNIHLGYYDATNGKLRYAHWVGGGGNCGDQLLGNTVWRCDTIDAMGTGLGQAGISLAADAGGHPNIVYQDASDTQGPAALKIARPSDVVGQPIGNCGPSGGMFLTWQCDVLDTGGSELDEANYASLTFNSAGLATVAYFETDHYYVDQNNNDTGYLKVLQQVLQVSLPLIRK